MKYRYFDARSHDYRRCQIEHVLLHDEHELRRAIISSAAIGAGCKIGYLCARFHSYRSYQIESDPFLDEHNELKAFNIFSSMIEKRSGVSGGMNNISVRFEVSCKGRKSFLEKKVDMRARNSHSVYNFD